MANSTAGTIIERAWSLLRTSGTSTDVPALQEPFMLALVDQANREWLKAHRRGGGAGPLTALRDGGFDLVADTRIDQATVAAGAVSFAVEESADFDAAGGGVVWDEGMPDVFTFSGNAADAFSGVSGLAFAHEEGDTVQKLYKLPPDFYRFRPSETYGDGVRLNGVPLRAMQGPPSVGYFSQLDDGTDKYLWLPKGASGQASFLYDATATTIDAAADTVDVPPESDFFLVWRVVQNAILPKEGGQPSPMHFTARQEANKILREALQDRNIGRYVRVRQFGPIGPLRDPSLFQRVPRG